MMAGPCCLWNQGRERGRGCLLASSQLLVFCLKSLVFLGLQGQHFSHCLYCHMAFPHVCLSLCLFSSKGTRHTGLRSHPTLVWPHLNLWWLPQTYSQMSYAEVLGVRTSTYLFGGHNSTHKKYSVMTIWINDFLNYRQLGFWLWNDRQ